jgi:hypothetical protein
LIESERAESRPFPGKKPPTTRSRTETTPERSPSESVKRTKVEADITKSTELAAPRYTKGSSEPSWSGMGYPAAARPDVTRQVTPSFGGSRIETEYTRIPIPRKDEILKEFNGLKNKLLIGSESPSNPTWCDRLSITQTHGWSDRFVVIPPRSGRRRISVPFLTVLVEHPNSWLCMTGEGMSYIQNLKHDIRQKNKNLKVTIQRPKGYHTAPFSAFIVDYLGVDYRSDPDVADIYFLMEFADQFRANCVKYYLRTTPEDIYTGWRKFLSANPGTFPYNRSFKFPDTPAPAPPAALNNAPPLKRSFSEFLAEDATPAGNRASRNTPERRPPPFLQLPLRIRAAAPRAEQPPNPRLEQPAALRVEQFETYTLEAARKILFAVSLNPVSPSI